MIVQKKSLYILFVNCESFSSAKKKVKSPKKEEGNLPELAELLKEGK